MSRMKKSVILSLPVLAAILAVQSVKADVIADWTFQTSASTNNIIGAGKTSGLTQSGISADIGSGTASASHASSSAWSIPAGNGSTNSWSVNTWAVNDYFQFSVSTIGFSNIVISYDQNGSGTGPSTFQFAYSLDGTTFNNVGSTYVIPSGVTWTAGTANVLGNTSFAFDLSDITAIDNMSSVYFRIIDSGTTSINGGTVGTGGTDRIDNFIVSSVPEPSSIALAAVGGIACLFAVRRKK